MVFALWYIKGSLEYMGEMEKTGNSFVDELLQDYYAECEEHLDAIRKGLLEFEEELEKNRVSSPSLIDDLFRRFHTLKGLSAMVGVEPAQQLSHHIENYLRALKNGEAEASSETLARLSEAIGKLEEIISCHREKKPLPDITCLDAKLSLLIPGDRSGDESQSESGTDKAISAEDKERQKKLEYAWGRGWRTWRVLFTPSKKMGEQELSVNTIRERLQSLGELIYAVPLVTDDGEVRFEFIVAGHIEEKAFQGIQGVDVCEIVPSAPAKVQTGSEEAIRPVTCGVGDNFVRVDLRRLDELMGIVGELVMSRARLVNDLGQAYAFLPSALGRSLQQVEQTIGKQLRYIREAIMRMRLVPLAHVFERMRYAARDLARRSGKKLTVKIEGEETEIDKHIVERIMDPLLHLVRNAVSHGIEDRESRLASGKPEIATVTLRAFVEGDRVVIEVADDGAGIDFTKIKDCALERGLIKNEVHQPSPDAVLALLCEPGFTTRQKADLTSGRGVGMTVVYNTVRELGGTLRLESWKGKGTVFTLVLPLTLSIVDALIIGCGGHVFAVPIPVVQEVIPVAGDRITIVENNHMISYRGQALPLIDLVKSLGIDSRGGQIRYALVIGMAPNQVGIGVERLLGRHEIVVRSLKDPLLKNPAFSGATELGNGRPVLILEANYFLRSHSSH